MQHLITHQDTLLAFLLSTVCEEPLVDELFKKIHVEPSLLIKKETGLAVPRAVLAQALNMMLFANNLIAVPEGNDYVNDKCARGQQVVFDHGALRTIDAVDTGRLPRGEAAFKRILEPLGYNVAALYPLPKLKMTGRAYRHLDFPETVAQFFVSELHIEQFSSSFQEAAIRVVKTSVDPLSDQDKADLLELQNHKSLSVEKAVRLLPALIGAFDVQHATPDLSDYEILLKESAEMAWISTEGNRFNHATDRVEDVYACADEQRAAGRAIKEHVEVSADGRVRQTALKATQVDRLFNTPQGVVVRRVPGSFYEFITRDYLPADEYGVSRLALHFDTSNAQGIFKMTATQL